MTEEEKRAAEAKEAADEAARVAEENRVPKEEKPVTQEAIDAIYKTMRETQERLDRSEARNVDLVGRLAQSPEPELEVPVVDESDLKKKFSGGRYPQTEDQWDDLIAEHPTYGTDLRRTYLSNQNNVEDQSQKSRDKVREQHPDMFLRDSSGKFILDVRGNVQFDMSSKKAQLATEFYERDPSVVHTATGPELIMAAVERRLAGEKEDEVKDKLDEEKRIAEEKRAADAAGSGVASGGGNPPPKPNVEVKFNSDAEKASAEKLVASGTVASLAAYCQVRDDKVIGYGRGGF